MVCCGEIEGGLVQFGLVWFSLVGEGETAENMRKKKEM